MPEINGPGKEPLEKRRFISEKIVKQPLTKRQIAKRMLALFCIAVLFGVIAAVSFVLAEPLAKKYLVEEPTQESPTITIPKDEPETMQSIAETEESSEEETEPIEDILQSAMEKYRFSIDDLNSMYSSLRVLSQEADKGIVIVHSVQHQIDWFDNPVENTGLYAGVVIASTGSELLILTPDAAVEEADSIKVTFSDGTEVDGIKKQSDQVSGMAIVSVSCSALDPAMLEEVKIIELGNSYTVKQGDAVIAIGGPVGLVHSTDYGFISYVTKNVQVADGVTRILFSDVQSNASTGTFLMNTSGQLIGWVTDVYKSEGNVNITAAMAISDYKSILEKMTNGRAVPYFGIKGQEINSAMAESGLPEGVYVSNAIADGPAYNSGIQNGDIITKIETKIITTIKEFQSTIEQLNPEEVVKVTIQRNGRDEYKEIEYQVTIGAR